MCSEIIKLSEYISIVSVLFGVILHFIYQLKAQNKSQNHLIYDFGFYLLFLLGIVGILSFQSVENIRDFALLSVQSLGFCLLGLCTISIYNNKNK